MVLNEDTIKKELRKLTDKDIKMPKRIYSSHNAIYLVGPMDLNPIELRGALAHELVHITEKHLIKFWIIAIALIGVLVALTFTFSYIRYFILPIGAVIIIIALWYLLRYMEKRADLFAARRVGKKPVINILKKIGTWEESNSIDIVHGKISTRIKRIENLDLPDFIKIK